MINEWKMIDEKQLAGFSVSDDSEYWIALMAFIDEQTTNATAVCASCAPLHQGMAREFNGGRLNILLSLKRDLEARRVQACATKETPKGKQD